MYRHPPSKAEWLESFSKQMEKALSFSDEVYIMGDINIDCKNNEFPNNPWKHIVELHDFHQRIKNPTRVTAHTETIIDFLYASNVDFIYDVSVPVVTISDHYPIGFIRSASRKQFKRQAHKTIQYVYAKCDEERFHQDLSRKGRGGGGGGVSLIFHAKRKILISAMGTGHRPSRTFSKKTCFIKINTG